MHENGSVKNPIFHNGTLSVKNSVLDAFVYDLCGQSALGCDSAVKVREKTAS